MILPTHPRRWIFTILALAAAPAIYFTASGSAPARDPLELTGLIAAAEILVQSPLAGRIDQVSIHEGDLVTPGQLLASFDHTHTAAAVSVQKARLAQLRARLARARHAHDLTRDQAKSAIANLEARIAVIEKSQTDVQARVREIAPERTRVEGGMLIRQESDAQALRLQLAQTELHFVDDRLLAARGELDQLRLSAAQAGADSPDAPELEAAIAEADAALAEAVAADNSATVRAPRAAIVAVRSVSTGQFATIGQPLFTLSDLDDTWAQIYIPETSIAQIRIGQPAAAALSSGETVKGEVAFIAAEADFATQHNAGGAGRDLRTFGVRVRLPNPQHRLRPGISVRVRL